MKKKRRKKTLFEFLKFLSASREATGKMWNSFITRTVAVKFFFCSVLILFIYISREIKRNLLAITWDYYTQNLELVESSSSSSST